jgi:hypothetical protein
MTLQRSDQSYKHRAVDGIDTASPYEISFFVPLWWWPYAFCYAHVYIYMQMLRCTFTFHLVLWCGRYQFIIKLCFTSTNRLKCNQKVYFRSLAFIEFIHSQFPPTVGFIFEDMLTLGAYCREILLARFFKID